MDGPLLVNPPDPGVRFLLPLGSGRSLLPGCSCSNSVVVVFFFPKGGPPFLNLPPLTLTALEAAILPLSGCADGAVAPARTGQMAVAFLL